MGGCGAVSVNLDRALPIHVIHRFEVLDETGESTADLFAATHRRKKRIAKIGLYDRVLGEELHLSGDILDVSEIREGIDHTLDGGLVFQVLNALFQRGGRGLFSFKLGAF